MGGITAVISLFFAMVQFSDLVKSWHERKETVSELVSAARIRSQTGDYAGACDMVQEALQIEPGSRNARHFQMDLAMTWLRSIIVPIDQDIIQRAETLLPALYRGTTHPEPSFAANAFAHLCWADHLRYRLGRTFLTVDRHFEQALKIDPDNTFASAMWAYWLRLPEHSGLSTEKKLEKAEARFLTALNSGDHRQFVRHLQIQACFEINDHVRMIQLAHEMRKNNERAAPVFAKKMYETFRLMERYEAFVKQMNASAKPSSDIRPKELLSTFHWIIQNIDLDKSRHRRFNPDTNAFITARLTEETGDRKKAVKLYHQLHAKLSAHSLYHRMVQERLAKLEN